MGKYKVCVYAISKDEDRLADRWMDSMGEADLVVVTDTGSADETVERLRARGAVVYEQLVEPWRFDVARNLSLSHVPEDADICVCTDLDEVFEPGWRDVIEQRWEENTTLGSCLYNWSHKPDGTPEAQLSSTKIHVRHGYSWRDPVYEWLSWEKEEAQRIIFLEGVVLNRYPPEKERRKSHLDLLELGVREEPASSRLNYYLGREYLYEGQWENGILQLKRYLELPTACWPEERAAAMGLIAHASFSLGNTQEAYAWYYRAIAEAPHMRDAYVAFARIGCQLQDWPLVFCMAEQALKITAPSCTFFSSQTAWDHTPNDLAALAAFHLGMYARSAAHARQALELAPEDERLHLNLKLIENKHRLMGGGHKIISMMS